MSGLRGEKVSERKGGGGTNGEDRVRVLRKNRINRPSSLRLVEDLRRRTGHEGGQ